MAKIESFEKYTKRYDLWFDENSHVYESEILAIKELLTANRNGVEIGVGSGRFAQPLGIKHGIEPSGKMRELAVKRGIDVVKGVAEKLPYPNNLFDYTLMVTTICFLDNPFYNNATFYSVNEVLDHLTNSGFKGFIFRQTIFKPLEEIKYIESVEKGYGKGSFVVIKANK